MTIIFYNNFHHHYLTVGERAVAGDLVGEFKDGKFHVDQSDTWLFDWEKTDPNCYARRMQTVAALPIINR